MAFPPRRPNSYVKVRTVWTWQQCIWCVLLWCHFSCKKRKRRELTPARLESELHEGLSATNSSFLPAPYWVWFIFKYFPFDSIFLLTFRIGVVFPLWDHQVLPLLTYSLQLDGQKGGHLGWEFPLPHLDMNHPASSANDPVRQPPGEE